VGLVVKGYLLLAGLALLLVSILVATVMGGLWWKSHGPVTPLDPLVKTTINQVIQQLPSLASDADEPRRLLVLPFEGDAPSPARKVYREKLVQTLADKGAYDVVETLPRSAMSLMNKSNEAGAPLFSPAQAVKLGREAQAELVLLGNLDALQSDVGNEVKLLWTLVNAAPKEQADKLFSEPIVTGEAHVRSALGGASEVPLTWKQAIVRTGWSLIIWTLFTLLLPVLGAGVLHKLLEKESNWVNLVMLVGLTLLNLLVALALMGFSVAGILESLLILVAFLAAGVYNYLVLDKLEDLRVF
jgi:hypothetical protein